MPLLCAGLFSNPLNRKGISPLAGSLVLLYSLLPALSAPNHPLPEAKSWGERLVRHRKSLGLLQEHAAHLIGVDPSTLAKWERGEREPAGVFLEG